MFSRLHNRLGTAGLVVAIVALIAALAGTAFAATKLNGTQKQEVEKIAKKVGKPGPTGPQGPAGPAGAPGAKGDTGAAGGQGIQGKEGKEGKEGSPWTAGGTLPVGKTETGAWALGRATNNAFTGISFTIPLAEVLDQAEVHYILPNGKERVIDFVNETDEELTQTACLGTAAQPKAVSGNLCVYQANANGLFSSTLISPPGQSIETGLVGGAGISGARLVGVKSTGEVFGWGSWAVTG